MNSEEILALLQNKEFNTKQESIKLLFCEVLRILVDFGIPMDLTPRRHERTIGAFLALADVKDIDSLNAIKDFNSPRFLTTREIIEWENQYLQEDISSGSYDDIRRKDLKRLVLAGIVLKSSPDSATNDSTRGYAINPLYADVIKKHYGKGNWDSIIKEELKGVVLLNEKLLRQREMKKMPVTLPGGAILEFSPGEHNELQKKIIEIFLPNYGYGCEILYVGDTLDKGLFKKSKQLIDLGIPELSHDELPDIICYSRSKDWLYLIEAVHSSGPISEERLLQLKEFTNRCKCGIVYVTCFLDMKTFRKYSGEIAWETEVWIAERPEHLIHFNGDKFIGPHK